VTRAPYFRIDEVFGSQDGIRWGYAKASGLGFCMWTYDLISERARIFVKPDTNHIATEEVADVTLSDLAREAIRSRLAEAQGRAA
jgi:hypothetical protein